ncbi:unnamed protein product [Spirodela intermedia]|uniref:Uncharacterized protein n=1 Tax=Spirodela intermedia TaxID=51605 RepID=A0ABN7E8F3_SPIIN|nr:unnamed protein product [Spirodela intermedia]
MGPGGGPGGGGPGGGGGGGWGPGGGGRGLGTRRRWRMGADPRRTAGDGWRVVGRPRLLRWLHSQLVS